MSYNAIADTRTLTHDEWLALRRTGIGGRDNGREPVQGRV